MELTYSVITATRNSEATLERTLQSLASQCQSPAQLVVVDGGSTDRTRNIFEAFVRKFLPPAGAIWIDQGAKRGIANAWNLGLRAVDAEVVCILNSDDWYDSACMSRVMKLFASEPSVGIVTGSVLLVSPESERSRLVRPRPTCLFPVMNVYCHPATFVRRSVYQRVGDFDERLLVAADYDFLYRCFCEGVRTWVDDSIVVSQQAGGFASQNRRVSRREVCEVGIRHSGGRVLPWIARSLRGISGR